MATATGSCTITTEPRLAEGEPTWPNSRPGWDRAHPDYQAWLANLQAEGIQLLVVTRVNPAEGPHNVADADGFPVERRWAERHPEVLRAALWRRGNRIRSSGSTGSRSYARSSVRGHTSRKSHGFASRESTHIGEGLAAGASVGPLRPRHR